MANDIKIGGTSIDALYIGADTASAVYIGADKAWPADVVVGGASVVNFGAGTENPSTSKKDMVVPDFQSGDVVFAFSAEDGVATALPTGWTQLAVSSGGATSLIMWSDTESTLTNFGTDRGSLAWVHLRGYDAAASRATTLPTSSQSNYDFPLLTNTASGSLIIACGITDDRDILSFAGTPVGFTNLAVSAGENGSNNTSSVHVWGQENFAGGDIQPESTLSGSSRARTGYTIEVPTL